MTRRRSTMVCLGLTAALATSLTGCGSQDDGDPEYTGICVDKSTGVRLEDSVCNNDPLPDESDFTAVEAAAATTGAGPSTTDARSPTNTTSASPTTSSLSPSGSQGPSSLAPSVPTTASASTSATDCVPATGAPSAGPTVTATLPPQASTTSTGTTPTSVPTTWEGVCPPGQTPSGSPSPVTTTVYRSSGLHGWFFIPWGWSSPAIGGFAGRGSYAPPTNTRYTRGGMSPSGGTISKSKVSGGKVSTSRGGFGSSGGKAGS